MSHKVPGLDAHLRATLSKIDQQIHVIQNEAARTQEDLKAFDIDLKYNEYNATDIEGNYKMIPLLLARSNVLLAIALNQK